MNTDRLKSLAISDTGFIFDPATGASFNTNAIGMEIIHCLKSGMDDHEIVDQLLENYEVSQDELEADVMDFIRSLVDHHLV